MLILNNKILEEIIGVMCPNNFISNDVLLNKDSLNQQSFLQKKRSLENNNIKQKYENVQIKNNNSQIENYPYRENYLFAPKLINPVYNDVKQFKFGDLSNYCNFIVYNNIIKKNVINNNKGGNIYYHLNGDHFNNYWAKKYSFENKIEDINKINNSNNKNLKDSLNEKNNTKNSVDCNKSKNFLSNNKNIFKISREIKHIKKLPKQKNIKDENNNEIKVLNNKKVVYVNSFLLNSYSTYKNKKRLNKLIFLEINRRGSKYRGVSKNSNQYQVQIKINKKNIYIGSYTVEEDAARIYDILTLKFRDIKAKTNFNYSYEQIKKI